MNKSYLTVESITLSYLNKAEFLGFLMRVIARLPQKDSGGSDEGDEGYPEVMSETKSGLDALYISEELVQSLQTCIDKLSQITRETRSSTLTAELAKLDEDRDALIVYILNIISRSVDLPFADLSQAAIILQNSMKVYNGANYLPVKQETAVVKGMIMDAESDALAPHVETLGLKKHFDELKRINDLYEEYTISRSDEKSVPVETAKELREEATLLYEELADRVFAANLLHESEETRQFILALNQEIKDTIASYNQRKGMTGDDDEEPETPDTDGGSSGGNDDADDRPVVQ